MIKKLTKILKPTQPHPQTQDVNKFVNNLHESKEVTKEASFRLKN